MSCFDLCFFGCALFLYKLNHSLTLTLCVCICSRRVHPPSTLLRGRKSNSTMLQVHPPAWSMSATAPADWTLLQQDKALRLGESPPPMHFLPNSHRNCTLATTALGMQPPKRKRGWRLLMFVVLLGAVVAAYYGVRVVQPRPVVSSPSAVPVKLVTTAKRETMMKKNHDSAIKPAFNHVNIVREGNKSEEHRHRRLQIHKTTRGNHVIDTNTVMTRKSWMGLFKGATPPQVKMKEKQIPKWLERFIVQCDKFKWKGQRFLI